MINFFFSTFIIINLWLDFFFFKLFFILWFVFSFNLFLVD